MSYLILQGNAARVPLADASVQCVVTSPPYWGLRDYGTPGQLGLESSPEEYLANMVAVFREVHRVLRDDGTLWLNIGDSYASNWPCSRRNVIGAGSLPNGKREARPPRMPEGLKEKDLVGIPWRLALALQQDGWYLRSDIIWSKPNPMPESVTDRPTKAHEYLFLLTKSERYYYDADAIRESPSLTTHGSRRIFRGGGSYTNGNSFDNSSMRPNLVPGNSSEPVMHRNARSVWTIATEAFPGSHFATFPTALVKRCVLAGTSEKGCCARCGAPRVRIIERTSVGDWRSSDRTLDLQHGAKGGPSGVMPGWKPAKALGWEPSCSCNAATVPCTVFDPFSGAGTVPLVADRLGRRGLGLDLSLPYCVMARDRLATETPLFADLVTPPPTFVQEKFF